MIIVIYSVVVSVAFALSTVFLCFLANENAWLRFRLRDLHRERDKLTHKLDGETQVRTWAQREQLKGHWGDEVN